MAQILGVDGPLGPEGFRVESFSGATHRNNPSALAKYLHIGMPLLVLVVVVVPVPLVADKIMGAENSRPLFVAY